MQRIATSVPDIAALPVNVKPDTNRIEGSFEQFNQLLRERDTRFERFEQPVERDYAVRRPEKIEGRELAETSNVRENERPATQSSKQSQTNERPEREETTSVSQQEDKATHTNNSSDKTIQDDKGELDSSENSEQQAAYEQDQNSTQKPTGDASGDVTEAVSEDEVDWLALLEKVEKNAQSALDKEDRLSEESVLKSGLLGGAENSDELLIQGEQIQSLDEQLGVASTSTLDTKLFVNVEESADNQDISVLEEFAKLLNKLNQDLESGDRAEELAELQGLLGELLNNRDASLDNIQQLATNTNAEDFENLDLSLVLSLLGAEQQNQELTAEQLGLFEVEEEVALNEVSPQQNAESKIALVSDKALDALLKLDGKKLDDALANLAERINQLALDGKNSEAQRSLLDEEVVQKAVNLFANNEQKSQFIANLKAGLNEMSKQLQQGREPGLNLKSLVEDSLSKSLPKEMPVAELNMLSLDLAVNNFSKALEVTTTLQPHLQQQMTMTTGLERGMRDGTQQIQLEQAKQAQQQMNFDKAANINRPEGQVQIVEKVRWMVNQNNLQADIRLDPPELGSMKVKVQMSGEAASVSFVVQSQQARDVFEQNAPRLKELLEEQGIQLGQSSVEQEQNQTEEQDGQLAGGAENGTSELDESTEPKESRIVNGRIGGIDYFV